MNKLKQRKEKTIYLIFLLFSTEMNLSSVHIEDFKNLLLLNRRHLKKIIYRYSKYSVKHRKDDYIKIMYYKRNFIIT